MVSPSPDLERRMDNTGGIVEAQKPHLVPGLSQKYPGDYLDLDTYNNLIAKKPWIEPIPSEHILSLQQPVVTGGDKVLVICVDFSDKPYTVPTSTIYDRYFGTIGNTFRNYYSESSYGMYTPDGIVLGWYRVPNTLSYYRDDPSTPGCDYGYKGDYPHNVWRLFEDVLGLIDADPNVTRSMLDSIDVDRDGNINRVMILHAGVDASWAGDCNGLWALMSGIAPIVIKGKTFQLFALSAEYISSPTDTQRSGIDVHEFGHILGLPDLYDTGIPPKTYGVGIWSVMGHGSWGGIGNLSITYAAVTPVHFDIWCKSKLGWVIPFMDSSGIKIIRNIENYPDAYTYTTSDPNEYFMIENRQNVGFDSYLPGNGLLIWHINENRNQYSDVLCHTVSLVQADNLNDLENRRNKGDSGDPYPGSSNNRSFTETSLPNSSTCNWVSTKISITNISDSSFSMTMTVTPMLGTITITSSPIGAKIYIDNIEEIGKLTPATISNISPSPPSHTYKLTLTGYNDKSDSFDISPREIKTIDAGNLVPVVTQAGLGTAQSILLVGLTIGMIYSTRKKAHEHKYPIAK